MLLLPLFVLSGSALALFPHRLSGDAEERQTFSVAQPQKRSGKTNDTIVQMFQWNWDSVAKECTEWLGPAGYGYAQVSPPQEHITGAQWWTDYQPVSHTIQSKRGSRAQFKSMVETCNAAGVGIIVDAVLNLTGGSGTGVAGNTFTHYDYSAVPYISDNFHSACDIDSSNETSIWVCQLDSLADLRTETDGVRTLETAYLADLMSLGVVGFRLDAARSMDPADILAFLAPLSTAPFIVQECYGGSPVTPNKYTGNGKVMDFRAGDALKTAFVEGGGLTALLSWPESDWVESPDANIFVVDHDTERDGSMINSSADHNAYTLASVFLLAQAYGTPTIFSGYDFTYYDEGAPVDSSNNALDTTCFNGTWRCEQRWTAISNMVAFHNAVADSEQTNAVATSSNQISFGRGAIGHVAINFASTSWTVTLSTDVPDGSYCEILHDADESFNACSSSTITVSAGKCTVTVAAYDAVAFFVRGTAASPTRTTALAGSTSATSTASASSSSPILVSVTFVETASTSLGQTVIVVGSAPQLGSWAPTLGVKLSDATSDVATGVWMATVSLPASSTITYKFLILNADGTVASWESDPNRSLTTGTSSSTVTDTWK